MLGLLLIDKPAGMTSHDVVYHVRKRLGTKRVGHAGTLDPLATGLLVVAVGHATRFLNYLDLEPKVYEVDATFGLATSTYDLEGEVTHRAEVPADLDRKLRAALPSFLGETMQRPPVHSAVKVDGKKLYEYARRGDSVYVPYRKVSISSISIRRQSEDTMTLEVVCGGGTFVRSLVHDLGQAVGCPAHVSRLRRTRVGTHDVADAVGPKAVTETDLVPMSKAMHNLPWLTVDHGVAADLRHGRVVASSGPSGTVLVQGVDGNLICLAHADGNLLQPKIVIPSSDRHVDVPTG
ncbi:MAG: tRNA pseudouridine(55) synthase TruB [Fimbriimonadaceae bacterium]|nr:tRNA pseudouridine(55) synthase TruB [Fimbriimonadaceae bacterium]